MAASALADAHDVVGWLRRNEELVGSLYARAAQAWCDDTDFSSFLSRLAEDEQSHAQFMSTILSYLAEVRVRAVLDIVVDSGTRDRIETPLKRFQEHLAEKSISKRCVIEYMAKAESCELNPVFLYIVEKLSALRFYIHVDHAV